MEEKLFEEDGKEKQLIVNVHNIITGNWERENNLFR